MTTIIRADNISIMTDNKLKSYEEDYGHSPLNEGAKFTIYHNKRGNRNDDGNSHRKTSNIMYDRISQHQSNSLEEVTTTNNNNEHNSRSTISYQNRISSGEIHSYIEPSLAQSFYDNYSTSNRPSNDHYYHQRTYSGMMNEVNNEENNDNLRASFDEFNNNLHCRNSIPLNNSNNNSRPNLYAICRENNGSENSLPAGSYNDRNNWHFDDDHSYIRHTNSCIISGTSIQNRNLSPTRSFHMDTNENNGYDNDYVPKFTKWEDLNFRNRKKGTSFYNHGYQPSVKGKRIMSVVQRRAIEFDEKIRNFMAADPSVLEDALPRPLSKGKVLKYKISAGFQKSAKDLSRRISEISISTKSCFDRCLQDLIDIRSSVINAPSNHLTKGKAKLKVTPVMEGSNIGLKKVTKRTTFIWIKNLFQSTT